MIILNPARRQPQHPVNPNLLNKPPIVADNHDGPFKPPEIPSDNLLGFRVKMIGGFIENKEVGLLQQDPAQCNTGFLTW